MLRGPSCAPVGRPKFALPTVPLMPPKSVRLKGLNMSARYVNRTDSQIAKLFTIERFSLRNHGLRNWLL